MFPAGELTARITLERDTLTYPNGAEVKGTPVQYAIVWARPECLAGHELLRAREIQSAVNWRFAIRYRSDVAPQHRVIYKGQEMEIRAVIPDDEMHYQLTLLCEARA